MEGRIGFCDENNSSLKNVKITGIQKEGDGEESFRT